MTLRSTIAATAVSLVTVLATGCGQTTAAGLGQACGPNRGCMEGLTCASGTCARLPGNGGQDGGVNAADGGTTNDGGTTGNDGGTVTDGGTNDGGTVTDGGTTTDGGSSCGPCDTPPDVCHAAVGTCQNGACVYAFIEGATCDDGNPCTVQDTCTSGACTGTPMVCNTPPAAACTSATQLSTYDASGVCTGGRCIYTKQTITCGSGGCVNNACQTDPCASMTCNQPPSVCYGSGGTCSNGSCSYPYADGTTCNDNDACTTNDQCNTGVCKGTPMSCGTPPPNGCENATTAKIYDPVGACSAGACSYTYHFVTCAAGCANGACNGSGWAKMVSNTNASLYAVWGSSATDVWAGGMLGTMMHWDGVQWQSRSSSTQLPILSVSGTSATDVFAVAASYPNILALHFDGTAWTTEAATLPIDADSPVCVHAIGTDDAIIGGYGTYQGAPTLLELHAGTVTSLSSQSASYLIGQCGVWAFSASDVYFASSDVWHFDGSAMTKTGAASTNDATSIWAASPQAIFTSVGGNVQHYDGTTWQLLNTALNGYVTGLGGSSPTRVFASAYQSTATNTTAGFVLVYDGVGWTQAPIPSGTPGLNGIYAAPNGEVFAVGDTGTIVHGP